MTPPTASAPVPTRSRVAFSHWLGVVSVDLAGFGGLALAGLLAGMLINSLRDKPLPLAYRSGEERLYAAVTRLHGSETPSSAPVGAVRPEVIGLDGFEAFVAARKGLVIDTRLESIYREGHVPGAINLPRAEFEAAYRRLGAGLNARKGDPVAVYCSGADCRDSELVAAALEALGFRRVLVYKEGWEEWSQSGLPQEK